MDRGFNQIKSILDGTIKSLRDFIYLNGEYIIKITELNKNYNVESNINFNIFTSLSDYYYRENLHSDILKIILDPHTETVGNIEYMKIFINFIEEKLNKRIILDLNNITIERETNRIDLLIYDPFKNCIFIENKINNANDMDDQIGRYYDKLLKKKYSVNAIVYLTLSPLKKLDWEYSVKDPIARKEIKKILVEIPSVNKTNESNFVDDVIGKCINESNNPTSMVYLTEYYNLLKYLGGNFMAQELNTKAMYEIFADKNTLESFRILGNLWDNRYRIIGNTFKEYFQHELGFSSHSGDINNTVFKTIKTDINIGFHTDFSFGFVHTPNEKEIDSQNKELFTELLKELLEDNNVKKYFTGNDIQYNGWWVYGAIDYNKINCLNDLKILEEYFEKIIKEKI